MKNDMMPKEIWFACPKCAKTFKRKAKDTTISMSKDGEITAKTNCPGCGAETREAI